MPGQPKRPMSAYFLWMNENREQIKKDHPGLSIAEFGKKAGELWKAMTDKSVSFCFVKNIFWIFFQLVSFITIVMFIFSLMILFSVPTLTSEKNYDNF